MELNKSNVIVSGSRSSLSEYANYTTVYPKPVMVEGKIVLTQEIVSKPNVKYVIKWNFDLNGTTVTIPEGCLLEFDGGAISNGTLVGQSTILIYNQPLNDILTATLEGTWRHESGVKADEEDITDLNGELKFKDKDYNAEAYSGLGRKHLRKNIVNGVNTLTQSMINKSNTIYVIQYDFTLGEDITVPANCILEFDGGSISGAGTNKNTITGNSTHIVAPKTSIFTGITIAGTWNIPNIYSAWFSDITEDNKIKNLVYLSNVDIINNIYIDEGIYNVSVSAERDEALTIKDNTNVYNSGTIVLSPNAFSNYHIVGIYGENIKWQGGYIRGDKDTHTGTEGEWGHGISICNSKDVIVENINISYCWGDCIALSLDYYDRNVVNKNIIIRNFTLTEGRRQGISIITAENCLIENGTITDIYGTNPQRCIDIEPNTWTNSHVKNIILRNLKCINYKGKGAFNTTSQNAGGTSSCSDILIDRCHLEGEIRVVGFGIAKNITVINSTILASSKAGAIYIYSGAEKIRILNNYIANSNVESEESVNQAFIKNDSTSSHIISENYIITGNIVNLGDHVTVCKNDIKCPYLHLSGSYLILRNNTITTNSLYLNSFANCVIRNNILNLNLISEYDYTDNNFFISLRDNSASFCGNIIRVSKNAEVINLSEQKQESLIMSRADNVVSDNIITDASGTSITDHSVFNSIFRNLAAAATNYIDNTVDSNLVTTRVYNTYSKASVSTKYKLQNNNDDVKQLVNGYKYFNETLGIPLYVKSINYTNKVITWVDTKGINMAGVTAVKGTTAIRNAMSLTANNVGLEYFDTDLGKPIYWTGTAWVDATGTPV